MRASRASSLYTTLHLGATLRLLRLAEAKVELEVRGQARSPCTAHSGQPEAIWIAAAIGNTRTANHSVFLVLWGVESEIPAQGWIPECAVERSREGAVVPFFSVI